MTPADFIGPSVGSSVEHSVWCSVDDSVRDSVGRSVRDYVRGSVGRSVDLSVCSAVRGPVWDTLLFQLEEPL
jgi:hypothetical protein